MEEATVTVRLIKSFEFKNFRNVVFHGLNLSSLNITDLERMTRERIAASPLLSKLFPIDSQFPLDTFKRYYTRHAAKTNNAIINMGDDQNLVLCDHSKSLSDLGFTHETEISFFNWDQYPEFCNDPKFKWE
jgi:hypothetical protein